VQLKSTSMLPPDCNPLFQFHSERCSSHTCCCCACTCSIGSDAHSSFTFLFCLNKKTFPFPCNQLCKQQQASTQRLQNLSEPYCTFTLEKLHLPFNTSNVLSTTRRQFRNLRFKSIPALSRSVSIVFRRCCPGENAPSPTMCRYMLESPNVG
jgi:hypothetical protein